MTDKNREFAELCGACLHELHEKAIRPLTCKKCGLAWELWQPIPDFADDPRLVLREMDRRPDGKLFYAKLLYGPPESVEAIDDDGLIERRYMTDTTGLLRDKAIEWMKGRKG